MTENGVAVIVGVGPGLGAALGRRFARAGMAVALASRDAGHLDHIVGHLAETGGQAHAYAADATEEAQVRRLFDAVEADLGPIGLTVFNAGAFMRQSILEAEAKDFERCWRVGCFGGFLVGREAAKRMTPLGRGTILFTGATASLRGSARFFNLAVGKFGLRALAQAMARELGPRGIHVAHVVIDGQIGDDEGAAKLGPDAIAETYYQLHIQDRSAWAHEVDLRPWVEKF